MKAMGFIILLLLAIGCTNCPDTTRAEKDVLHLEAKIPLPGVHGRIDHLAYDTAGHRVFVAALGNNTVEVVDLVTLLWVHTIKGLHEPQGLLYISGLNRLVVANAGDGACVFYDGGSYAELGRIGLGDDADNIRYNEGSRLVYIGYGSGGIALIDPVQIKKIGDLPLKGHPESFQLAGRRLFVNVPNAGEIVTADRATMKVMETWKNTGASANFPMALDDQGGRLFIGYRHPAEVRVVETRSGKVLQSLPCSGDADDLFYDRADSLVFVSAGEGFVDVFNENVLINHIATAKGARTSLWLPREKKLLVAVPARDGGDAAVWVYGM